MNEPIGPDEADFNDESTCLTSDEHAVLEESVNPQEELPPIVTITDPRAEVLALVSQSCSIPPNAEDVQASSHMADLLDELGDSAVALAAPQIGLPHRFFVMRMSDGHCRSFFNPVIKERSNAISRKQEGCLSVTGASVRIERPRQVRMEYIDISGQLCEEIFTGLYARAVCHEIDHLNGRIIMEHMAKEIEKKTRIAGIRKKEKKIRVEKRRAKNKLAQRANRRNRS